MAETTTELERIYTIPLRHAKQGTRSKRANRAIGDVRTFLTRHMKSEDIWIAGEVNELIWSRGKFTIPSRVRVRATRFSDGVVEVTLPESDADGSVRAAIEERQEKAAETPVLAPIEDEADDEEETHVHEAVALTAVAGIGPAMAQKLEAAGIEDAAALAHADVATVTEATGRSEEQAKEWIEAASTLSHADAHADASDSEDEADATASDDEEE